MSYLILEDFKAGLDRRRLPEASAAGSLQVLKNAHINRGGEIEKAKIWLLRYTLPANTFGLLGLNTSLYVFGSAAAPSMPVGTTYQRLQGPDGNVMTGVSTADTFSGAAYVVGLYATGLQYHFYDGAIIDDWYEGLVRASMTNNTGIATHLTAIINADTGNVVIATSAAAVITVTADATNVAFTISATTQNKSGGTANQTAVVATTTPASVGVAQISTVTIGGTFEAGDGFTVTINGRVYGISGMEQDRVLAKNDVTAVITHKNKMYATAGVDLFFSGVATPDHWKVQDVGAGVIDMSAQTSNEETLTALGVYQNNLAIFTRNTTQVWSMDADPDANVQLQVLDNVGTQSPKTVVGFGDSDVFFLSDFGIRSLRARDASNSAGINDVGTPIDDLMLEEIEIQAATDITVACAAIEPRNGRYVLSINDKLYVFSYFPSSRIAAWSTWEPGFSFTDFANLSGRLYGRHGDNIYLLGGYNNDTYTDQEVIVEMPYLDARTIGTWKRWTGIDLIVEGKWDVYVNTNPLQPDVWIKTATIFETSIGQMKLAMQQHSPVLKFKFVHQGEGAAKISKIIVHYEGVREK